MIDNNIKKRSITIQKHKTSITLEDAFWQGLSIIAKNENKTIPQIISWVDNNRSANLSSAVRIYVLNYYMEKNSHLQKLNKQIK